MHRTHGVVDLHFKTLKEEGACQGTKEEWGFVCLEFSIWSTQTDSMRGGLRGCQAERAGSSSTGCREPGAESSRTSGACPRLLSALPCSHGTQGRVPAFLEALKCQIQGCLWIVSHGTLEHDTAPQKEMQSGHIFLPKEKYSTLPSCFFFFSPSVSKPSCSTVNPNSENQKQTRLLTHALTKTHRAISYYVFLKHG